ncbi:MAG TPA: glycosyltransferase family 2 protein [Candidatus Scatomonas pullistercoris]|uniref:Glycosyltransferase family 2 protein n=1 Tax=Candidatus Scatomonas pullistercoris TaxID=2840920 RepID=A0A9D1P277_9FIRM|nr:glycosyltransferase family 2 protein [Candidatus Scatomonas pullistercoris]
MREQYLISVLMVNYNKAGQLRESIESVLGQTYRRIQFIIVDDGSTDESPEIIREYAEADERVEAYLQEENRKISEVTNFGLRKVRGEYLARIDSDDLWAPEKLERQLEFMTARRDCEICFTGADLIDENGQSLNREEADLYGLLNMPEMTREENLRFFFCHGNHLVHASVMMTSRFMRELGDHNPAYLQIHDFDCWVRAVKKTHLYKMPQRYTALRRFRNVQEKNTSARTEAATVRYQNECMILRSHFFDGMTEELFTSAFREMFRYPEASSPEELACEKAFLLCGGYRPGGRYQPILGIFALEELLRNERTKQVLEEVYNYTPATFYGEMAQHLFLDEFVIRDMEAERQQFGREKEDLQREVERLEADAAEMAAKISARDGTIQTLQTELRTITGSRSWKATAPIRKVLDQIKRK